MTYLHKTVPITMIELSLSSPQTASSGSMVLFDTIRATGAHGVSTNATTGEVTLNTAKHYYVQASIDVTRSSTSSNWRFAWVDSTGTEISATDGGYDASWEYSTTSNATYTAVYQSTAPLSSIRLKATTLNTNSTINLSTKVLILEAQV